MKEEMRLVMLFPAYAGVILWRTHRKTALSSFPRIRGGDPHRFFVNHRFFVFSPHTRG